MEEDGRLACKFKPAKNDELLFLTYCIPQNPISNETMMIPCRSALAVLLACALASSVSAYSGEFDFDFLGAKPAHDATSTAIAVMGGGVCRYPNRTICACLHVCLS